MKERKWLITGVWLNGGVIPQFLRVVQGSEIPAFANLQTVSENLGKNQPEMTKGKRNIKKTGEGIFQVFELLPNTGSNDE